MKNLLLNMRAYCDALTPDSVMRLLLKMYCFKVVAKVGFGLLAGYVAAWADGLHNTSDIVTAVLLIYALTLSLRPPNDRYPNGFDIIETISVLVQGAMLSVVTVDVLISSCEGVYGWFVETTSQSFSAPLYVGVAVLYCVSALLSFVVGMVQQQVGERYGRPGVVADGAETISDGYVELGVLAGALSVLLFGSAVGGHIAGLFIAGKLALTSFELVREGVYGIMQRSLGEEHVEAIRRFFMETPSIFAVPVCKVWRVGSLVRVQVQATVPPVITTEGQRHLEQALAGMIRAYFAEKDMPRVEIHFSFDPGDPRETRIAYAVKKEGGVWRVVLVAEATHLWQIDVVHGCSRSVECIPLDPDLWATIQRKEIRVLLGWDETHPVHNSARCRYEMALSPVPPQTDY